jgi:O-acetyl-ADP-ribose deacetylase (regulator of RNase III)
MREIAVGHTRLQLIGSDITMLGRHVGAIVNACDESLRPSGGVCAAIHRSGGPEIAVETLWAGGIATGTALATTAGRLHADVVLHAVGPIWTGGHRDEDRLLASAYRTCLEMATERELSSIAFPSISTGMFGFPIERAAAIAIGTVTAFLKRGGPIEDVLFVLFTDQDYRVYATAFDRWERHQAARARQAAAQH